MSELRFEKSVSIISIIFLLLIGATSILGANKIVVGKCCPLGQVFSVTDNFTCAFFENRSIELYPLKESSIYGNFSVCEDTKNLTVTYLDDIVNDDSIRTSDACVDVLWDENSRRNIPIVFQCEKNESETQRISEDSTENRKIGLRAPILTNLRICCDANSIWDVKKHDCVYHDDDNDIRNYFQFFNEKIDFLTIVRGPPKCKYSIVNYIVNVTKDLRIFDNGKLEIVLSSRDESISILANEENSCFSPLELDSDQMIVRVCGSSRYCRKKPCIKKCCPEGEILTGGSCQKKPPELESGYFYGSLFNVTLTKGSTEAIEFLNTSDHGLIFGYTCKFGMFPVEPREGWHITEQGYFYLHNYRAYFYHEYCFDMYKMNSNFSVHFYPFVCFDEPNYSDESPIRYGINAALEITSCAFLVVTLLVYICLPSLQNLHGKTLMCHVASLIVAYASLAVVALATPTVADLADPKLTMFCKGLGYTVLLSWISAFTWLNVMCFDIWWTFGGQGGTGVAGKRSGRSKKRFILYSLYAWGFAILLTGIGVLVDQTETIPMEIRPNMGIDSCWFERNTNLYGEIIFFIGPVSLQLVANVIFFVLTSRYCNKVKAEIIKVMAAPTDPRNRRFRADRGKLVMNIKLFIVMGVSWSLEAISSVLNHYATSIKWRNQLFYVFDAFNCLQGLLIFMLFVLKSKVYQALKQRLGREKAKIPANKNPGGLQDPYRVKNSASSSTIMSTFGVSA